MNSTPAIHLAMWSGPRNVSTALMRSFGSRDDTAVCDEPLYAHYLKVKRRDHPLAREIVRQHETDWRKVVAWLTGPVPGERQIFYQKHMAHHLTADVDRGWLHSLRHAFLIREPAEMLTSLIRVLPNPVLVDTGLPQQVELLEAFRGADGRSPPVVDSRDLLEDPPGILRALCERLGIPFQEAMLTWEPGPRVTDGCWADQWYGNTLQSTGFAPYRPKNDVVPDSLQGLLRECEGLYRRLYERRLTPA